MAEESFQERTEQATPKKREEARKKGQVAKSRELPSIAVLLAGLMTLFWGSSWFYHNLVTVMRYYLHQITYPHILVSNMHSFAITGFKQVTLILWPLFLAIFLVAILSNYLQIGPLASFEAIKPKWSKISPTEGFKRLFSAQAMMEFAKSLFKLGVVSWIAYNIVVKEFPNLPPLIDQSPEQIISYIGHVSFALFWKTCLVMIFLAIIDFIFQKYEFEKSIRMTKQEIKEEYKQTEGDPNVKSRIRSIQREQARKRMMAEVPQADVIITNPTHLAIAIKYESGRMKAPMVIAKGAGLVAEKIREIARKHSIPVIENKPLARSLYQLVDMGEVIPESLYRAVAEVLAYVYGLKGKKIGKAAAGGN
jgi:flagellar biosynthetic protein FlhB